MPAVRNDEVFTVLVLGSRLAEQLTLNLADDQASFEAYLNRHWLPPSGKTFRVVNGAVAGHKAPIWFYQLSVFLNRVDAVIVFEDHYEEILNDGNLQLEEPPTAWQITKHATLFPMEVFLKRQVSGLLAHSIISKSFSASAVIRKFNDSLNERSTESQTSDPIPPFRDVDNATARSMNLENYLRYSRYADRLAEIEDKDFFLIFSDPSNDQANARSSRNTLIDYFKLHAKDINFSMPPAGADLQTVAAFAAERMAKHGGWRKRQQP